MAVIGPLTLKMWLFTLMLLYIGWSLLCFDRIRLGTALLIGSFAALLCLGGMNGVAQGANMQFLGEDVSPLLSFLALPFFELTMRTRQDILLVIRVVVIAAIGMACCYAVIVVSLWLSLWLGVASLGTLYGWLAVSAATDFGISGDGTGEAGRFAYSGALFLGIAIIFLAFKKTRWSKAGVLFLFFSLILVASRGLFLTLALSAFCYVLIAPVPVIRKLGTCVAVLMLAAACLPLLFSLAGDRTASNEARLNTISQVSERIGPGSLVVGHGFGIGVPEKPKHMEIAYLEIFHKQGVLGLFWWAALIGTLATRFRKALPSTDRALAYSLFLVALFVLLESATNPYIDNPIGMYPFLISFAGLGVLAQQERTQAASSRLDVSGI
jgi:hypothetical protein